MHSKGEQITALYAQFQSLKSKIYGKSQWMDQENKRKAQRKLRESTISHYHRQFKKDLQLIQLSQQKNHRKKQNKKHRQEKLFRVQQQQPLYSQNEGVGLFSKQLRGHRKQPSIQHSMYRQGQQRFRQMISTAQKIQILNPIQMIQPLFEHVFSQHQEQLSAILETVTFLAQKVDCLQRILQEAVKVFRARLAAQTCIVDIRNIQAVYEQEMTKLKDYYEDKLREVQSARQESNPKKALGVISRYKQQNKEQSKLQELLIEARKLLATKQELITILTQQNITLRQQLQKKDKKGLIGSGGSSLRYSGDRIPQPRTNSKDWIQFDQQNQDIDYSELDSIKQHSMQNWDLSKLQSRQNTDNKSLLGLYNQLSPKQDDPYE